MGDTDDSLREGIYEDLITPRIEAQLAVVAAQLQADSSGLDNAEAADRLALHLAALVERAVSALPEGSRATAGTEIVRKVGLHLAGLSKVHDLDVDLVAERPQVLRAVRRLNPDGTARSVTRPLTPLLDTTLLINARGNRRWASSCSRRSSPLTALTQSSRSSATAAFGRCWTRCARTAPRASRCAS